jgi:hypothetical protein
MVLETESGAACSKHQRGTTMEYYAGIDVSLETASLCVVEATGRIVREAQVATLQDLWRVSAVDDVMPVDGRATRRMSRPSIRPAGRI